MLNQNHTTPESEIKSSNAGYKLVFDNIDKTIKPRHMRQDSQTSTLHYVQAYAVRDRINYCAISHERRSETNLYELLPDLDDYSVLKERFIVNVSRVITCYLDFFKDDFSHLVQWHIPHKYSTEMCQKSEVVSKLISYNKL